MRYTDAMGGSVKPCRDSPHVKCPATRLFDLDDQTTIIDQ